MPFPARARAARIRSFGTATIALAYVACAVVFFLAPEARWIAIAVATALPPSIEYFQPKIWYADMRPVGLAWFGGYCMVSAAILLGAGLFLVPEWVAGPLRTILVVVAALAALLLVAGWSAADPSGRRTMLVLLAVASGGLAAAIVVGPPTIRWMAIGTIAAFTMAFVAPPAAGAEMSPDRRGDGLEFILDRLDRAERALRHIDFADPDDFGGSRPGRIAAAAEGLATLQNLHFISGDQALEYRRALQRLRDMSASRHVMHADTAVDALAEELFYAQVRLRTHLQGARDPDLLALETVGTPRIRWPQHQGSSSDASP